MRNRQWIVVLVLILASCNLPADRTTDTPPPDPILDTPPSSTSTPTLVPIETLLAVDTPTVAPTSTPSFILASPKDQPVNCRYGPGIAYAVVGALIVGRQAEVIGKSIDVTWWYVKNPNDPSTNCWLSADFVTVTGNVDSVPVVGPPEIGVNNIRVRVEPVSMNVGCSAFPQSVSVSAEITTNGPTLVTWRWETSAGGVSEEKTLLFESEATKTVQTILTIWSANDYWVNLHVVLPNDRSGGANFKVTCTP
ncbi:MAG: hypothetical protein C3F07_09205 [Anaerolineales bacterium]|nr:MAG: hypothetical protein C3F07_09205 [Anaerolineales bacterium]